MYDVENALNRSLIMDSGGGDYGRFTLCCNREWTESR